jgi:hypothetical protein
MNDGQPHTALFFDSVTTLIDVLSFSGCGTAIQSELVLRTNQSVAEHYNLIFPAVLMNNERFSINFTLKNYTNNEKTRKPNRMLTPNAGRKKLNNARR